MKYFIAIALFAAVASAAVRPTPVSAEVAEIQEIIAAIQSPSTDPATAAVLEQMLHDMLGVKPEPVEVGPAIVEPEYEGIAVGPAIIPFPLPEGALAEEPAIVPSPVSVVEGPAHVASASSPLVQIVVNVNQAAAESSPISVGPAIVPEPVEIKPEPVHVVEAAPEPVQVVEVAPEPVQVVEVAPVEVEPVQIGVPIIPEAAVVLPEELN